MVAMSALVFGLSWWLGLYLLARNPRKPVLVLAAIGLIGYSVVVALDAIRVTPGSDAELLGRIEVFTAIIPSVAWLMVLVELTNSGDRWRDRAAMAVPGVVLAVVLLVGASLAGTIAGPARLGHWIMFCANGTAAIGAAILLFRRRASIPGSARGVVLVATMFFTLGDAQLIIPLGIVPSWLALASTGFDLVLLGLGVALWDAFDEGQALRGDMLRSFVASILVGALFGAQAMIGIAVVGQSVALVVLLFTSIGLAICIQVQSGPFADFLDRLAFSRSPQLRQERSELRSTEAALPLKSASPIAGVDDESFIRLTRRALSHYGDLAKLVASPLAALPVIDERLAGRGASDQPVERANELRAVLAESISRLKPRNDGDFGTTDQWRYYNALYFPYVMGVRAYAQGATAAGLDPVSRQAWQWLVTEVPQRSLHNWQNAAAKLIAADLRAQTASMPNGLSTNGSSPVAR